MQALQFIRENCNCCVTGKPLLTSKTINVVQLSYEATWEYPIWGYVGTDIERLAVAYLHDICIVNGKIIGEVKYAVETRDNKVIYHELSKLIKIDFSRYESYSPINGIGEILGGNKN